MMLLGVKFRADAVDDIWSNVGGTKWASSRLLWKQEIQTDSPDY